MLCNLPPQSQSLYLLSLVQFILTREASPKQQYNYYVLDYGVSYITLHTNKTFVYEKAVFLTYLQRMSMDIDEDYIAITLTDNMPF